MTINRRNQLAHYAKFLFALRSWTLGVLFLACFVSLHAQQITGTIVGTVKDQTGALVNTATIKATNIETGLTKTVKTNNYGEYRIDYLPVGRYTVVAEAGSFKRFVQENLTLDVDQSLTVDIPLSVGAQSETVTVETAPPQINTSTQELGRTLEAAEIVGLPLVNRNVYSELTLTPGVTANNNSAEKNPTGSLNFTVGLPSAAVQINGSIDSGSSEVAFYLDGGINVTGMRNYGNPSPNPDALQEFRVETSAFGAQYGHYSAAVISVITKSGTNKFHGGAFEFNRTTALNDTPWVPPGSTAIKQHYRRNQFGGFVGGPIVRDRSFFFFSYAGLRQVTSQVLTGALTPTAAERLGDFTADTFVVYTPGAAHTAANQVNGTNSSPNCATAKLNCIPQALLDTAVFNMDNCSNSVGICIPLPNGAANTAKGGAAWTGQYSTPVTQNEYLAKYDESFGQKDHLAVTYFFIKSIQGAFPGGNIPWTINQSLAGQTNANISEIHTFSGNLANQTWLTFTRAAGGRENLPVTGPATLTLASFGSNFLIQGPAGLPTFSGLNFGPTATNAGPFTGSDNYELRDMITWTKGRHTLFLGGEFALDKTMFLANLLNFGSIGFSTSAPTSTGNVTSDWVTGQASSFEQDTPYSTLISYWHIAGFAQDNFRVTPRFTANLGIRYDIDTAPVESLNHTASFIPGVQSTVSPVAPKGMAFPGDPGVGRGIISTKYTHVSPRIGFAWNPFGDGKTSVRAAAGIFYDTTAGNEWNQPGNAAPFAIRQGFGSLTSLTNIYSTPGDFPSTAPGGGIFPYIYSNANPRYYPTASVETITTAFKYPYTYQFNLAVQQELPGKVTLQVAYVGSLSHDIPDFIDSNYAPYSTVYGAPCTASTNLGCAGKIGIAERRQFDPCPPTVNVGCPTAVNTGTLGSNTELVSIVKANYHSLQVSASKQLSHHFNISGYYVWARGMESAEPTINGGGSAQDWGYFGGPFTPTNNSLGAVGGGLQEEKGPMNADNRSTAVMSGMWTSDYYHGSNHFVKAFANGWQIAPIAYFHSGGPFTVTTGSNNNFDSANASRPDYVPGVSALLSPHRCRICLVGSTNSPNSVLNQWFNTAAFTPNGPGVLGGIGPGGADGNAGRNILYGPGYKDIDMGLFKTISFERGIAFQIRAEATNVFNIVSIQNPTASLTSANYGKITAQEGTQRIIQVGGRLTF